MKKSYRKTIEKYFFINIGLIITALSFVLFLIPGKIAAGGVSGIATIVYHLFGFRVGMVMLLLNIPLFITGVLVFGKGYGIKTFFSTIMLSIYIDLFSVIIGLKGFTNETLLSAAYGGIMAGTGIGIIMKMGGSTGGTDIVAQILNKFLKIPVGYALMAVDFLVLTSAGLVFGMESALYAVIALFATGRLINLVLDGIRYSKVAFIISHKYAEIREMILFEIDRGGTVFYGKGLYTDEDKKIVMSVVKDNEIAEITERIKQIDKEAFIVITDAYQVLGEGFKPIKE